MDTNFKLFTSVRYDKILEAAYSSSMDMVGWNYNQRSALYMFDLHRDRLYRAATHLGWSSVTDLLSSESCLETLSRQAVSFVGVDEPSALMLRILFDCDGKISFEKAPVPHRDLENLYPRRLPAPGALFSEGDPTR